VRELKFAIERSVYRSKEPEQPIADIVLDAFDSPFKITDVAVGERPTIARRNAPLLPADLKQRLIDMEADLLTAALEKARFNQRLAADLLGLSYHQFRGRLRKLNISSRPGTV
jgi:psp operon transcriptional activator